MKTNLLGFLAAAALGLSSAAALAEDAREAKAVRMDKAIPVVQVTAVNQDQAERLLAERKRHQDALRRLQDEHQEALNEILASAIR